MIGFLLDVFEEFQNDEAIIWKNERFSYAWLKEQVTHWVSFLQENSFNNGQVVSLEADFSPNGIALFLALIELKVILVPLTKALGEKRSEFVGVAQVEKSIRMNDEDQSTIVNHQVIAEHPLYTILRHRQHPGLVLFSSGSTGQSKAIVHDMSDWLEKYRTRRHKQRMITFLLFDHGGGVNTMLHVLSNGGTIITVQNRDPDSVLDAVEKYKAEVLPTSPTFINLILLSEAFKRHDLSSLKTVTYGTEPMAESTLKRFHELFPHINLLQTYGLTETGVLRSKSKSSDSLWVKIGGEGFETRVVDGILQIKARSNMLGYLNSSSPYTEDDWFITGDEVEQDGEYFRILGRRSELINVGGQKVYPAEVESVIQEVDNVAEVTVYGEKNPITGSIVCARLRLKYPEDPKLAALRVKKYCRSKLQNYQVPVKVHVINKELYSDRFKKIRKNEG